MSTVLLVILFAFSFNQEQVDSLIINNKNDAWKMSMLPIGGGIVPFGQLENNKPIKALTIAWMRMYWYNELEKANKNDDISDRNRSFWWLIFLYFYGAIDAYVDSHLDIVPEMIDSNETLNNME